MDSTSCLHNPFAGSAIIPANWQQHPLGKMSTTLVDLIPGIRNCRRHYEAIAHDSEPGRFAATALEALEIKVKIDPGEFARLPAQGGVVVVVNHPFGALEGLILIARLRALRPDVRFLANHLLERVPQLREVLFPVEVFDQAGSGQQNASSLRHAIRWVRDGGMLVVFPAGEVAHLNLRRREVVDPPWSPNVARLVKRCKAPVYPAYFSGRNSRAFQTLGLVHPLLRTALLPSELFNKRGATIELRFGPGIRPKRFSRYDDPQQLIDYLRLQTYLLARCDNRHRPQPHGEVARFEEIAPPQAGDYLTRELKRLPREQCLLSTGKLEAWHASAEQIPLLLVEIGRLREETFRQVGEGTGRALDLDLYDEHYQHLFLWDRETSEVVGAYRLGATDTLVSRFGHRGLYTHELFDFDPAFFRALGPALELGRSFVRTSYQRSFTPLLLLWQGIGQFLVRNPRYRTLFGPVSISNDYRDVSRQILASALWEKMQDPVLAALVKSRTPYPLSFPRLPGCTLQAARSVLHDLDDIDALIEDFEPNQKGIPVLLRHYLNLNGKILALNLDRNFQDALDALLVVDLDQAPAKNLERYMGKSGLISYQKYPTTPIAKAI